MERKYVKTDNRVDEVDWCERETHGKSDKTMHIEKALYDEVEPATIERLRVRGIELHPIIEVVKNFISKEEPTLAEIKPFLDRLRS